MSGRKSRPLIVALYALYAAALIGGLAIFDSDPDSPGAPLLLWLASSFAFGVAARAPYALLVPIPIGLLGALPFGVAIEGSGEEIPVLVFAAASLPLAVLSVLGGTAVRINSDRRDR